MPNLDLTQFVVLAAVIAGVTELLSRARASDWWVVATIATAAVIGGLFGLTNYYPNLDFWQGVSLGFGASGALTGLSHVGNRSSASESSVTKRSV